MRILRRTGGSPGKPLNRVIGLSAVLIVALLMTACSLLGGSNGSSPTPTTTGSPGSTASSAPTSSTGGPGSGKPNIVFVLTDDLQPNLLQYMPHVKAMEKAGATFGNYFVVDSLCCPSRTSILTGEYPHNSGVFTNMGSDGGYATFQNHDDQNKTFGVALQRAGYRTGFMGKYLNGYQPSDPVPAGWNEWDVAGNGYPEFNYGLNQNGTVQHYGHQAGDYLTDVLSGKATGFIDQAAAAKTPFALEVATFAPHAPSTPAPRDANDFPGLKAPRSKAYDTLPANPPSWLKDRPALTTKQQTSIDKKFRKRAQSVQAVDDLIGHLTDELTAKGLAQNTDIVFSSDNGFHMGEYRLLPGKQTAYDTDIHVPLVVTGPGITPGTTIPQLTSNIDLAPTFEALAGLTPDPQSTDGLSLVPLLHGSAPDDWPRAVLIEHHGPDNASGDPDKQGKAKGEPPTYEAIRTATATYVAYANGDREYYDLTKDPLELDNLAGTESKTTLDAMQQTLTAMQKCTGQTACREAAVVH